MPDQAQTRAQTESPADAAVDLVNETRYLDERTGPATDARNRFDSATSPTEARVSIRCDR